MTTRSRFIIVATTLIGLVLLGCWWFLDWGSHFQSSELRKDSSFEMVDLYEVKFSPSGNFVFEYIVGRKPSRSTTVNGYSDRILIEFAASKKASGSCEVIQVARTGYRRSGFYHVASPDDAWVMIQDCGDFSRVEAAIKITNRDIPASWDLVSNSSNEGGEVIFSSGPSSTLGIS